MAASRKLLVFSLSLLLGLLALPLVVGWILFRPDVNRVDPAILPELRAVGRVVAESSRIVHEWENSYAEYVTILVHIDGTGGHAAAEVVERLRRSGWYVWHPNDPELVLRSHKWTNVFVTVEPFGVPEFADQELRDAATDSGLPANDLVVITLEE